MTRYPKLRVVHTRHDRREAMVMGDEPGHYRPYAHIPPCENRTATNALADLFAAAPELIALLEEANSVWGGAFANDNPIDGGDLVEWFAAWFPKVRAAIWGARGAGHDLQYHH
jgi:hypothetical protein